MVIYCGSWRSPKLFSCAPSASLLREADAANQIGPAGVGVKRVERDVGAQGHEPNVAIVEGDIEPFESVVLFAQIGVHPCNPVRRVGVFRRGVLCDVHLDPLAQSCGPTAGTVAGIEGGAEIAEMV